MGKATTQKKVIKQETPAQRLSGIIKSCRQIMRKDKGINGDADRLPMLTWIMFLKFLDDNELLQEMNAKLENKKYKPSINEPYRWRDWAKDKNLTGDDLVAFINNEKVKLADGVERTGLFYYLRGLQSETGTERKDVIATVFKGVTNRMINGYLLRDIINKNDEIHFTNNEEVNTLSHLYESILKEMRDASGDAGEFYTPRPVVKFMVEMINPKIGETVLDPAAGTGGFLVETFEHLKKQAKTVEQRAAIVVPHGTLFAPGIAARVKKQLVDEFNLHTIVRLGEGIFAPYTDIPSNLLFFEQGESTKEIWYYELLPPDDRKKYSKTRPIQHEEFEEIKSWWTKRKENEKAWKVKLEDVLLTDEEGKLLNVNLDLKNPNRKGDFEYREPAELVSSIMEREKQVVRLMKEIEAIIQTTVSNEA
jgi:type I restriction-modification system DNA methylase subunit